MNSNPSYACELSLAKRELGAFISAVTESYGAVQAGISANDWLDEFESMDCSAEFTNRELRLVTIAAAVRLANRLSAFWVRFQAQKIT